MSSGTALLHLIFLFAMIGLLVGGTVGLLMLWYTRGRDPHVGKMAEYIEQPPDDLPPGAAGTLVDEHADHNDVVATLLGLGRHGAVTIDEIGGEQQERRRSVAHDYQVTVVDPSRVESNVERLLLRVLFGGDPAPGTSTLLSDVKGRFDAAETDIRDALYEEMVSRGYFRVSPAKTRQTWRRNSWIGLIASIVVGLFLAIRVDAWALFAMFGAIVLFVALIRMSRIMPQKTRDGAEQAQKWRAFRAYLRSIERHTDLREATDLFDRYFAYAVAFGIEKQWVRSFARVGARTPSWFHPSGTFAGGGGAMGDVGEAVFDAMTMAHWMGHLRGGQGDGGDIGVPNVDLPNVGMPDIGGMPDVDLQGMSDLMGGGLQGASDGLGGLLDAAGGIFESIDFDFFN